MKFKQTIQPGRSLRSASACSTALALALPTAIFANAAMAQEDVFTLDTLEIEERSVDTNPYAEQGAPYKAKISGDARRVKPLAETPQTITVLTQTALQESGKTDLRDVLAAQPGISLGTGENGNAFGDRYVIRGHEARSDVFVDGLRDPGMTTRESFAVEQIEITKGPSSTFAGRGSSGGAINSITKQASTEYDFTKVQIGLGTDKYQRYTLDTNQRINDDLALRANILYADEDVPDRDPAAKERTGVALSAAYHTSDKLKWVADYYFLKADDKPDLGTYIDRASGNVVDATPSYVQAQDFLDSEVETLTLRTEYEFGDAMRLVNSVRYGTTDNGYVVTGASGTTRHDTDTVVPGAATISFSTHQGWQEVDYLVDQLNLFFDTDIAGMEHSLVIGAEYSELNVLNGNYGVVNTGTSNCVVAGRGGVQNSYCGLDGSGNAVAGLNTLLGRSISKNGFDSDYNVDTLSLSIMDTVELSEQWSVFLGLRLDDFEYDNTIVGRDGSLTDFTYSDTLWNGHAGVVYQFTEYANAYFTYSTAANINGGESDVGGNCGYGGICGDTTTIGLSKPETVENIELGTKWNIMDEKLLLTAAIFQITKDDVMEGTDYETTGTLNTGKHRVEGFEASLAGNVTDKFSLQAGFALMNAEILDSFNNGINLTTDRSGNVVATTDTRGKTLANFADNSAFLLLRYQLTDGLSFGGSATYSSEVYTGQPDTAANEDLGVPSYTVYDIFANYDISEQMNLRLNVGNVTDKDYYFTAYRSGAFTYIGDARNAQLTLSYEF